MKLAPPHLAATALLAASLSLCGCPDNNNANNGTEGPTFDAEACTEFVVPTAMALGWEKLNHRISTWAFRLDGDCPTTSLEVTHIGGDYSTGEDSPTNDTPTLRYGYRRVTTAAEEAGVARVTIDATIGPDGVASGGETYARADLTLRNYPAVVAIIDGVRFETGVEQSADYPQDYDPSHGYTMRTLGAAAAVSALDDDGFTLDWELVFQGGPSPDRPKLNAALEHARVGASLDVLLVGVADPGRTHTAAHSYSEEHPLATPLQDEEVPHAAEAAQKLELSGDPDGPAGFYGFGSFRFDMNWAGCSRVDMPCDGDVGPNGGEEPGEYVREISVSLRQSAYDSGAATFLVDGYLSNASRFLANYADVYDFRSTVVWVQAGEVGDEQTLDETFETGTATFELD